MAARPLSCACPAKPTPESRQRARPARPPACVLPASCRTPTTAVARSTSILGSRRRNPCRRRRREWERGRGPKRGMGGFPGLGAGCQAAGTHVPRPGLSGQPPLREARRGGLVGTAGCAFRGFVFAFVSLVSVCSRLVGRSVFSCAVLCCSVRVSCLRLRYVRGVIDRCGSVCLAFWCLVCRSGSA